MIDIHTWGTTDPLGEALHFLRMSGTFYSHAELTAPWGIALPPFPDCMMFHVIISGRCWLEVEGLPAQVLQLGDLALVPHGAGHRLTSDTGADAVELFDLPREALSERYEIIRHGGTGAATTLVCAVVRFDHPVARQLISLLPPAIVVETSGVRYSDWMQGTLRLMASEARDMRPGGETVMTRLADILVIQAIRSWIDHDPAAQTGWLGALKDRQIGRAISLIHGDPARAWTLSMLASEVAMSRSAFAARFTELVGMPAMQYLARWRINLALASLKERDERLAHIASRVGYKSEAAFNRAFKRVTGVTPGAIQRNSALLAPGK
ncbi:AraC family transcriptional regulator [Noviherbaspirillum saxi]|uniref:AraC family transcriptional regulator n=1 Tax=Noviherbaspirillum saxi TaxID=2320863 RepID=A0A3A3G1T5_9BURK|nr:AraC family transcriptional regulator [Noviherbaspirillum saxi]RJF92033.1 AraC family transcriptional regulator [Noviherbaspirillum saxi]